MFGEHHALVKKPVMIASNHSNSFLDGVVLQKILSRTIYIFVRGDVFSNPVANFLLRKIRLFPIFRVRDAGNNAHLASKKNEESKDEAYQHFLKNRGVVIFSEAVASMAKTLLPIKRGTASIALEMVDRSGGSMDLQIIPAGVNYTFFKGLRKDVMVQFGAPVRVLDYYEEWKQDAQAAISRLTSEVEQRMRDQIICVDHPENAAEAEILLEIARNEIPRPVFLQRRKGPERFRKEKSASEFVNMVFRPENKSNSGFLAASAYLDFLRDYRLDDLGLAPARYLILKMVLVFGLAVPAAFGLFANAFSWFLAYRLANRLTRVPAFYDSMHLGLSWFLSVVFSLGFLGITWYLAGPAWAWGLLMAILGSAYISVWWFDIYTELKARLHVWTLGFRDADLLRRIRQSRKHLLAEMDQY